MTFRKPSRYVREVFLHCSASEQDLKGKDLVDTIRSWHLARKFKDVGYHYIVDKTGRVMTGRKIEEIPAAQAKFNLNTIAICAHGHWFNGDWYDSAQALALKDLCEEINEAYKGLIRFLGHNRVNPGKTCPVFSVQRLLETDRFDRMP